MHASKFVSFQHRNHILIRLLLAVYVNQLQRLRCSHMVCAASAMIKKLGARPLLILIIAKLPVLLAVLRLHYHTLCIPLIHTLGIVRD